jgi:TolA-binding protein
MRSFIFTLLLGAGITAGVSNMDLFKGFLTQAELAHKYEMASLTLAKENRELKSKLRKVNFDLATYRTKNDFLQIKLNKETKSRKIASIPKKNYKDLVNYDVYKWSEEKLIGIGGKEFHFKNFEKSAQFYNELIKRFPKSKILNDKVLFAAGLSAYESGKHYKWAVTHLKSLVKNYPKSKFYRGAKLWLALSKLNQGDKKYFYHTVEEFRQKYRNTNEWKILSRHYETINKTYNK